MTVDPSRSDRALVWLGRAIGGGALAVLLLDAWVWLAPVSTSTNALRPFGLLMVPGGAPLTGSMFVAGSFLYVFRRTAIVGAILLTFCLATLAAGEHRPGNPVFEHLLVSGALLTTLLWVGLFLRSRWVSAARKLQALTIVFGALPALSLSLPSAVGVYSGSTLLASGKPAGLLFLAMGLGGIAGCVGLVLIVFRTSRAIVALLMVGGVAAALAAIILPAVTALLIGPVVIGLIHIALFVRASAERRLPDLVGEG